MRGSVAALSLTPAIGPAVPSVRRRSREGPDGARARRRGGLVGRPGACEERAVEGRPGCVGIARLDLRRKWRSDGCRGGYFHALANWAGHAWAPRLARSKFST